MSARIALPPHDEGAERAVLSACILSQDAYDEVAGLLEPESFYVGAHRITWKALGEVVASGQRVDLVTLAQRLRATGDLDKVGGSPWLAELTEATPAVAHVAEHAKIVVSKARLRSVIEVCRKGMMDAYGDVGSVEDFCADLEAALGEVSRSGAREDTQKTARELAIEASARYYEAKRNGSSFAGLSTGIPELDRHITGLKRGCKYVVAARPGMGKTGFLLSVARHVAASGFGVVFISVEMPAEQQIHRIIAQEAMLSAQAIETGKLTPQEEASFNLAVRTVAALPLVIDEASKQTVSSIRSAVRRGMRKLRKEHPSIHLGLIVIDYLQLLEGSGKRNQSRENEVTEISRGTLQIAREHNVPLLEASQLNRKCEERPDKRPIMSDLRESGGIEQDAYGVLMLYRDDFYRKPDEAPDNLAEILVRKMRGGSTGRVKARFHGPSAGFFPLAGDEYDFDDADLYGGHPNY